MSVAAGQLRRREASDLIVGYSFDLQTNEILPTKIPNPGAGREHVFRAWRWKGSPTDAVVMRKIRATAQEMETSANDTDD